MARDDAWTSGDAYERFMGRWSARIAPLFIDWLRPPEAASWVDVGAGTGRLTQAILEGTRPASILAVEPSPAFLAAARENIADPRVRFTSGSAEAIPLPDASVDLAVAGLVLNFVTDPRAAMTEMRRVTLPGGAVGGYVWDYGKGMRILQVFWHAAMAVDPEARERVEALRFPLAAREPLATLFVEAGLVDVRVDGLEITAVFQDFDDYWEPYLAGTGPGPAYVAGLSRQARGRLRDELRARLAPDPDGSIRLPARAWAVAGRVPSSSRG